MVNEIGQDEVDHIVSLTQGLVMAVSAGEGRQGHKGQACYLDSARIAS
jgi:hypothetical protein